MRKIVPMLLVAIGIGAIAIGGYRALSELSGVYQRNLEDPLNQPDGAEKAASDRMFEGVLIGAPGIPLLLIGRVLWRRARAAGSQR
jgi:hypothetical protein